MIRFAKSLLATVLFTAIAVPTFAATPDTAKAATGAEKAKIEATVHQYLLQNPEVLVEALQILQKKQFEQAEATVKQTQAIAAKFAAPLFHTSSDPTAGNPNGKITIVEFFDYQCPHCVDMAPVMGEIIKSNPDVRIVYKEFPIRGPMSNLAARVALAANLQGKYSEMSHAILNNKQPITQDLLMQLAKDNGLDVEKLKKDMNDAKIDTQIKDNMKLGQDLKLFGTPAFFIGKTDAATAINYVPGQMDQTQLQGMIDKAKS